MAAGGQQNPCCDDRLNPPNTSRSIHRAPRRGRHRALGRQRRRQLRQRPGRDHQRPLQDRGRSGGAGRGARSKPSSSRPSNGWTGSTTDGCSSQSETSLPPRRKPATTTSLRPSPWPRRLQANQPPANPARFIDAGEGQNRDEPARAGLQPEADDQHPGCRAPAEGSRSLTQHAHAHYRGTRATAPVIRTPATAFSHGLGQEPPFIVAE